MIELFAFRNVLAIEQRLRPVESSLNPFGRRGEATPTRCGRTQTRYIAIGPQLENKRLHDRPQQRWRLAGPHRSRGFGRGELGLRGRRLQYAATAAQRRSRVDVRIVRRALLDDGPAFPARVDGRRRRLQQRFRRVLIPQAEHLAGAVHPGVGRETSGQDGQTCGKAITGGNDRAARGVHRLRINRQGSHAGNFRSGRSVAATHPMIAAAKLAAPPSRHNSLIPSVSRPEPRSVRAAGC